MTDILQPQPLFPLPIFVPENWVLLGSSSGGGSNPIQPATPIIGEIVPWTDSVLPNSQYFWCDGASYQESVEPLLYSVIGNNYGTSTASNPSSSSTSAGADIAYPATNITRSITSNTQSNQTNNAWTIVIPSNNDGGGSFTITSPLYISNTGNFSPFGIATLTVSTTITSVSYSVYKDGNFFATGTATPVSGAVNPFTFTVSNNTISTDYTANSFIGNYSFSFTPTPQPNSSTYVLSYILSYTTTSSAVGPTNSWVNTATPTINASSSASSTTVAAGGTITITSSTPSGYSTASVSWTGNSLFKVPDLRGKTPIGTDSSSVNTITYGGSSVYTSGNRAMSANQLASHNHSIISTTMDGVQLEISFSQNNSVQGIGNGGTVDLVKTATFTQSSYTATATNAGGVAEWLPPFQVCNFIIRARDHL
jgi:microcystin-dependent protein